MTEWLVNSTESEVVDSEVVDSEVADSEVADSDVANSEVAEPFSKAGEVYVSVHLYLYC